MKFVRYGLLKDYEQKWYKRVPDVDEWTCAPPRKKGMFAFPYGFHDAFYIHCRPASDPDSNMMYLRGKDGRKQVYRDLWSNVRKVDRFCLKSEIVELLESDDVGPARGLISRMYDFMHCTGGPGDMRYCSEGLNCREDLRWMAENGFPYGQLMNDEPRPSYVRIMKDPMNPPLMTADGGLTQECPFLLDANGERIPSDDFFCFHRRSWRPEHFTKEGRMEYRTFADAVTMSVYGEDVRVLSENPDFLLCDKSDCWENEDDLERRLHAWNVKIEQLFPWPVYPHGEGRYLTTFKKPHLFRYEGNLWHHLRKYTPQNEILCAYGTTWVYTSVRTFENALKKAERKSFRRYEEMDRKGRESVRFGGPYTFSGGSTETCYEVFFDSEDIRKMH